MIHKIRVPLMLALGGCLLLAACGGDKEAAAYKSTVVKRGDVVEEVSVRGNLGSFTDAKVMNLQSTSVVVDVLVEEGDMVKRGDILAWLSSSDRENLINTARINLERLRRAKVSAAEIKAAEEEVAFAKEEYQIVPVLSSIGGFVSSKRINKGENVSSGATLFVLRDRLIVYCQVNEADIAKVKVGQAVEVKADAYLDKIYKATVYAIANYGESQQAVINFTVKSELEEQAAELKLGMTADVDIIIEQAEDTLYLPVEFVQFEAADKMAKQEEGEEQGPEKPKRKNTGGKDSWEVGAGKRNYSKKQNIGYVDFT
jgi:macrolide-specific efflux system membrane fusion protein